MQSFSAAVFKKASNRAKNGGNARKLHRADAAKIGLTTGLTIVEKKIEYFSGCCLMVRRLVWEQITAVPQIPGKVVFSLIFSFFLPFSSELNVEKES